jgi:hypothetical protein
MNTDKPGNVAEILHAVLDATTATLAARDRRMRRAIRQAALALERGRDPLEAIAESYRRRSP